MKTTIDIPPAVMADGMKFTGAKTKREAVLIAVEQFNRLQRLKNLNARVRGKFRNFMTLADLNKIRARDLVKAI